jgi:acetolactate synthase-1/2/3 large subunit
VDGTTVTDPGDLEGALEQALASGKPALLDVHVDAEVRPPATGTWALPPILHKEPVYGTPWVPGD